MDQELKDELKKLSWLILGFLAAYFVPWGGERVGAALIEAFMMLQEYAREHVLLCLVPAFFIAGAIAVFVSQAAVLKYFGPQARKLLSYSVASVSGSVLAVCSCTVLPLFAGIYTRGAGIGPATAFLYSGPAINVLAIVLTARILGWQLGLARAVGAIVFAIVTGLLMAFIFRKDEAQRHAGQIHLPEETPSGRNLAQDALFLLTLVLILVSATIAVPAPGEGGLWAALYGVKWWLAGGLLLGLAAMLRFWFARWELGMWLQSTWGFGKQIMPLLAMGVLVAGFLLGRPGHQGVIPAEWVQSMVGGNSLWANFFASFAGALMYFATLTEVPILQGLLGNGMGQGPALALMLAGPALSLPNMLVIGGIMGWKKTAVFCSIIVVMSTIAGLIYGALAG
ncbi:permease [Desulfarculus baarsii DSM 2075]|uniref:Permease n=1 Tax=Desulfarculus baarsii (strain ATCC 33931 / DSM 2075 / LMG 7858 / VKM B-1802 / 2st14) TaxID=644282 RepID=E1QJ88_DESB2|nr:permease [Desulfarculus baarsii]ADK85631.1 permease [Desulfarculus baarsii DSM 2075]